jgi:small GTP-binding protein
VKYANDETYMIQLWDIAGQERFGQLTRIYYRDAKGAVVVFDITQPEGLEAARKWKRDFDNKLELIDERTPPVLLVANKLDLVGNITPEFKRDLDKFCADNNFIGWLVSFSI